MTYTRRISSIMMAAGLVVSSIAVSGEALQEALPTIPSGQAASTTDK